MSLTFEEFVAGRRPVDDLRRDDTLRALHEPLTRVETPIPGWVYPGDLVIADRGGELRYIAIGPNDMSFSRDLPRQERRLFDIHSRRMSQ